MLGALGLLASGCVLVPPGTSSGDVAARVPLADLVLAEAAEPRRLDGPDGTDLDPTWEGVTRAADLTFVDADLVLDVESGRVHGVARSTYTVLRPGIRELPLGAEGLEIHEVTDSDGRPLTWRPERGRILVNIEAPPAVGDVGEVSVRYSARPEVGYVSVLDPGRDAAPGVFAPEVFAAAEAGPLGSWLPTWPVDSDLTEVRLRLTVGDDMGVVANGVLDAVEEPTAGATRGQRVFRWRTGTPVPLSSVAFAAARFETFSARGGGTEIFFHLPAGATSDAAHRTFGESPAVLRFLEERLAASFPFPRYDQVVLRSLEGPALDGASLTLVDASEIVSEADELDDRRERPRRAVARGIARKWFGAWISPLEPQHRWLLDGLAQLLELDYEAHVRGVDEVALEWEILRQLIVRRVRAARGETSTRRTRDDRAAEAGWALRMIRRRLGPPTFQRLLREFVAVDGPRSATVEDFRRLAIDLTGVDLGPMIAQWGERREIPELEVRLQRRSVTGVGESMGIVVRQTQPGPLFRLELPYVVHFEGGAFEEGTLVLDARSNLAIVPLHAPVVDVGIDPDGTLLVGFDIEKEDSAWIAQGGLGRTPVERLRALPELERIAAREGPARTALVEILARSAEPTLRETAVSHMSFGGAAGIEALLERLGKDASPWVRRGAAHGLVNAFADGRWQPTLDEYRDLERMRAEESSPAVVLELDELLALTAAAL